MGGRLSSTEGAPSPDHWWPYFRIASVSQGPVESSSSQQSLESRDSQSEESDRISEKIGTSVSLDDDDYDESEGLQCNDDGSVAIRREENRKKLEVFKQELAAKREARHKAITASNDKLKHLQQRLKAEEHARIEAENECARLKETLAEGRLQVELDSERNRVRDLEEELQREKGLRLELERERVDAVELERETVALKKVASIGKEMLRIRELQVNELKKKLCEFHYPEDLREEYEAQIENVKRLKSLYEERVESVRLENRQEIEREMSRIQTLESKVRDLEREREEAESMRELLKSRVLKLDKELEERNDAALALQEQLDASAVECRDLASQMNTINDVFTRMLMGNTHLLEENQTGADSLTGEEKKNDQTESSDDGAPVPQEMVAENLPKIWEILVQLSTRDDASSASSESCYKSVDTPSGKRSVISVSQTFLTLKNLILEKNALVKEVTKLKVLNGHLESRLGNQEKRLTFVSSELKKTWGVVNKLKTQHRQLHTQEKILKYELQHKRALLNDLKDELEHCREIWDMARQKNCQSEEEWRKLRKEFADRRKNRLISNSAESGYEDDESNSPPTEENIDDDREPDHTSDCDVSTSPTDLDNDLSALSPVELNNDDPGLNESIETATETNMEPYSKENIGEENTSEECIASSDDTTDEHPKKTKADEAENIVSKANEPISCSSSHIDEDTTAKNISKFLEGLIVPDVETVVPTKSEATLRQDTSNDEPAVSNIRNDSGSTSIGNEMYLQDFDFSKTSQEYSTSEDETLQLNAPNNAEVNTSTDCESRETKVEPTRSHLNKTSLQYLKTEDLSEHLSTLNNAEQSGSMHLGDTEMEPMNSDIKDDPMSSSTKEERASEIEQRLKGMLNPTSEGDSPVQGGLRTTAEVLDARTERLKRLEEQCRSLFNKVSATNIKSNVLSSKLELLHEQYGRTGDEDDAGPSTEPTRDCDNQNTGNDDR